MYTVTYGGGRILTIALALLLLRQITRWRTIASVRHVSSPFPKANKVRTTNPVTHYILHDCSLKLDTNSSPLPIITVAGTVKTDSTKQVDTDPSKDNANRKPINYKQATSTLLGDVFHNFADGIFLGIAQAGIFALQHGETTPLEDTWCTQRFRTDQVQAIWRAPSKWAHT